MKILKDFNNKLCNRTEYLIEVSHEKDKTPANNETKKKISELTKTNENLVSIKKIYTRHGIGKSDVTAYVYNNEQSFKNFEIKNKKKKHGKKEKSKKQAPK